MSGNVANFDRDLLPAARAWAWLPAGLGLIIFIGFAAACVSASRSPLTEMMTDPDVVCVRNDVVLRSREACR
jgi:hypothetical protein